MWLWCRIACLLSLLTLSMSQNLKTIQGGEKANIRIIPCSICNQTSKWQPP
uniref:Photosystem I reaction center subunit psaK family protein n=1 Tax=Rhizophora mucronata TaxID=61149 RepID=A0A2P2KRI7_RHIMU